MANVAYDLSLFEEKQRTQQPRRPRLRELPKQKKQPAMRISPVKIVLIGVGVVAMLAVHLVNNAALTESKAQLEYQQTQVEQARRIDELLDVELERMLNVSNMDEYAEKTLGLYKPESHQIAYLPDDRDGAIQISKEKQDTFFSRISDYWKQMVSSFS